MKYLVEKIFFLIYKHMHLHDEFKQILYDISCKTYYIKFFVDFFAEKFPEIIMQSYLFKEVTLK